MGYNMLGSRAPIPMSRGLLQKRKPLENSPGAFLMDSAKSGGVSPRSYSCPLTVVRRTLPVPPVPQQWQLPGSYTAIPEALPAE